MRLFIQDIQHYRLELVALHQKDKLTFSMYKLKEIILMLLLFHAED